MTGYVQAEVKTVRSSNPNGEFEIVMSTDAVDRDGEVIAKGAFDPLPASVAVLAHHNMADPVGRAFPTYDGRGRLTGKGFFAATPRAQEIRQLVADGVISHTSVGFMAAQREKSSGGPVVIKSAELLEVSFVSVPSNREAAVLAVKAYADGRRLSPDELLAQARAEVAKVLADVEITHSQVALTTRPTSKSFGPTRRQADQFIRSLVEDQATTEEPTFDGRPLTRRLYTI